MVTFICPLCRQERTGARRRCYHCTFGQPPAAANERTRQRMRAVHAARSPEERSRHARKMHDAVRNPFDVGAYSLGRPSPKAKPVGSERVENGHIKVKCEDGKWRYRARVTWE